jgi:hypothetical protein
MNLADEKLIKNIWNNMGQIVKEDGLLYALIIASAPYITGKCKDRFASCEAIN